MCVRCDKHPVDGRRTHKLSHKHTSGGCARRDSAYIFHVGPELENKTTATRRAEMFVRFMVIIINAVRAMMACM